MLSETGEFLMKNGQRSRHWPKCERMPNKLGETAGVKGREVRGKREFLPG